LRFEPVELVVSSVSSRVETWRAKWNLGYRSIELHRVPKLATRFWLHRFKVVISTVHKFSWNVKKIGTNRCSALSRSDQ